MPEAEDVITDAARHATVFVQELWRRHRPTAPGTVDVPSLLHRLDLLIAGSFGMSFKLRISQPPAPLTFLRKVFARNELPVTCEPIPATDGESIWLPVSSACDSLDALRVMALSQGMRAKRRSPALLATMTEPLARAAFEVLEAHAADIEIAQMFPGMSSGIEDLRRACLHSRPRVRAMPLARRPLEAWVQSVLELPLMPDAQQGSCESSERAHRVAHDLFASVSVSNGARVALLFRDRWIGELREPPREPGLGQAASTLDEGPSSVRSARMSRRPDVRRPDERDERSEQGAWMVQTAQPHEHAEDPFGSQRPTDRDEQQAAEEFADSLSELAQARLVTVPGVPKEILVADDAPPANARRESAAASTSEQVFSYPEWDCRVRAYRDPGATVHVRDAPLGPREWLERTLEEHRALLQSVRRQFESLRAQRARLRQQPDGDEPDLAACVDALADLRAGRAMERGLYQCTRTSERELAVLLLIDVSGSTDAWVSQHRRVIDVEREALLLVCLALNGLNEPYSVLAFSGEGARGVWVRSVKSFAEVYGEVIALRIAGLEPEKYTRAGAAIRHATSLLMRQQARHRLLLLLSDGKPNDSDEYDGRYGIEDMRQAVIEARLQGISPFCLTIDRYTANYLPAVFGEHQYAVLHRPDRLPSALLGWLRRLVQS